MKRYKAHFLHSPGILKSLLVDLRRQEPDSDEQSGSENEGGVTPGGAAESENEFQQGRQQRIRQDADADDSEAASLLDQVAQGNDNSEEEEGETEEEEEEQHRVANAGATPPRPGTGPGTASGLKKKMAAPSQGPTHTHNVMHTSLLLSTKQISKPIIIIAFNLLNCQPSS